MVKELCRTARLSHERYNSLLQTLEEGTPPPDWLLSEKGLRPDSFPDPAIWFERMIRGRPAQVIAIYKQRLKMFKLGAVSGPLPRGLAEPVFGKLPMPAPEFIIEEDEDKWRLIWDFSASPRTKREDPKSWSKLSINKGYSRMATSLSFPDTRDKAAQIAAHPGGAGSTLDWSGMFYQIKQCRSMLPHQVFYLRFPGEPTGAYWVLRGNSMGAAGAPAGATGVHINLMHLFDRCRPGLISNGNYARPETIGLVTESDKNWQDFVPLPHESRLSTKKWLYLRGVAFGQWKTGATMNKVLIHVDDDIASEWKHLGLTCKYIKSSFDSVGVILSPKMDGSPHQVCKMTGQVADYENGLLGFSEERWLNYTNRMNPILLCEPGQELLMSIGDLLILVGSLIYLADVFYTTKPFFIPASRWLGIINHQFHTVQMTAWTLIKKIVVPVPKGLRKLIIEGWRIAITRRWMPVRYLLYTEADGTLFLSADACGKATCFTPWDGAPHPAGLGACNKRTGARLMVLVPDDHPLSDKNNSYLELFTAVLCIALWARKGDIVVLDEDNNAALCWLTKFKAKPIYIALVIFFSDLVRVRDLRVKILPVRTDVIAADPLSRTYEDIWLDDWKERARAQGIPTDGKIFQSNWEILWDKVSKIEQA